MLNNISISRYINTGSLLHKLNPLSKLISLLIFIVISVISNHLIIHILLLLMLLSMIFISKIRITEYLKSLKYISYLLAGVFIINILFNTEMIYIIISVLRIIEIVLFTTIITVSTSERELINGLIKFLKPLNIFKINVNQIAFILTISIRFIPVIIDQINVILKSIKSKGVDLKKNSKKLLVLKSIVIPTMNLSLKKADDLANSLEVRLYDVNNQIDTEINKWNARDTILILAQLLILIIEVII